MLCASCKREVTPNDGLRGETLILIGKPQEFLVCWQCWEEIYRSGLFPVDHMIVEERGKTICHIFLEAEDDTREASQSDSGRAGPGLVGCP